LIFKNTELKDALIIQIEKKEDNRGFMARAYDSKIFEMHGLNPNISQCNISFSEKSGTLRGMHYQIEPFKETKLIRCTRGSIYDVIVDLRKNSPTYKKWIGVNLNKDDYKMLYVPDGFAHGFITLEDKTEVFYQLSEYFTPEYERGLRWDDDEFNILWPLEPIIMSEKDLAWKPFED
jgi:dTDP-4-dehydrorhamnose 3,5-epimerase|tara:strand:+ start:738 stop:1268 length:531 start_codon:yes stop_codon:yes gene_type:complete